MQEFIVKRTDDGVETTAVDQALMKVYKDKPSVEKAIAEGELKEGEFFATIDDDQFNDNLQDEVRSLQEDVRELQQNSSDIASILPEDVSSDNLLETVQGVLTQIQSLDVSESGGNGHYIQSIKETDGKIETTVGDIDTVISNSTNPITSGAVNSLKSDLDILITSLSNDLANETTARQTDNQNRVNDIASVETDLSQEITDRIDADTSLSNRLDALEADPTTQTQLVDAINGEVSRRNTAITSAINNLDKNDSAVSGQYVSAVSESNGIISVTRASFPSSPTFSLSGTTLTITGV